MKLRQLQYVVEVINNGMNVTAAAQKLFTSQPGVSSQIKRLEEELGVTIFERSGKHINGLTTEGKLLAQHFSAILDQVENVKRLAEDFSHPDSGLLSIATTHTQARYVLPPVISEFREQYPNVQLQINQGTPEQIASLTDTGKADIGIATEALELFENLESRGAIVDFHDPFIPVATYNHEFPQFEGRKSVDWDTMDFEKYDAVIIATDHTTVDYETLVASVPLTIDTRNATKDLSEELQKKVAKA